MSRKNKGIISLCIPLLAVLLIFNSCEDPGSVGSDYVERPELTFDTLSISSPNALAFNGYSGRLGFIPIGQYSDPVFGDMDAQGLFKPQVNPFVPDTVSLSEHFRLKLKLRLDSLETYGDTLSQSGFSVYQVTSDWRGNALRIDDQIQTSNLVGSFTISNKKEVIVDLDHQWVSHYKTFFDNSDANADSLYQADFKGLAVISNSNNQRVSFARSDSSGFLIVDGTTPSTTDTVFVPLSDWGYTLKRTGQTPPANTIPLHTTLEGMLGFTMPFSALKSDDQTKDIIKAELLFYEATDELEANLPANHVRLGVKQLNLDLAETQQPVFEYQFGNVPYVGSKKSDEPFFRINVTRYINNVVFGGEDREDLVLGIGSASGTVRSTLIYGVNAPQAVRPKLIITSLVD